MSHELIQCLAKGNSCLVLRLEGWKQFSCVIAPCGGALQGAEREASHFDHISGEAANIASLNGWDPNFTFILFHSIPNIYLYIIPCSFTFPHFSYRQHPFCVCTITDPTCSFLDFNAIEWKTPLQEYVKHFEDLIS